MSVVTLRLAGRHPHRPARPAQPPQEAEVWDCKVCGCKAVAASLQNCPSCRAERGAEKPSAPPPARETPGPAAPAESGTGPQEITGSGSLKLPAPGAGNA